MADYSEPVPIDWIFATDLAAIEDVDGLAGLVFASRRGRELVACAKVAVPESIVPQLALLLAAHALRRQ